MGALVGSVELLGALGAGSAMEAFIANIRALF
jgi:hypothetical protein